MSGAEYPEQAGDPSCWLDAVCDECGGLDRHRDGCTANSERNDVRAD